MLDQIKHDDVLELRLARPPVNALDTPILARLGDAIEAAPKDGFGALVLSGSPGMFSGGLDVPALLPLEPDGMIDFWRSFFTAQRRIATSPVPVIAAITGHSPAGGAVLALHCDFRIMAAGDFKIGLNEVAVGLNPGPVLHRLLARLVGLRSAEQLMVSGALVAPKRALEIGLVDRVVAVENVVDSAIEQAKTMLALPSHAMSAARAIARADLIELVGEVTDETYRLMNEEWYHPETQATLRALVERLQSRRK